MMRWSIVSAMTLLNGCAEPPVPGGEDAIGRSVEGGHPTARLLLTEEVAKTASEKARSLAAGEALVRSPEYQNARQSSADAYAEFRARLLARLAFPDNESNKLAALLAQHDEGRLTAMDFQQKTRGFTRNERLELRSRGDLASPATLETGRPMWLHRRILEDLGRERLNQFMHAMETREVWDVL
jgi:hypothetical protein